MGRQLLRLFGDLTKIRMWVSGTQRSFPVIVLEPADEHVDIDGYIDGLEQAAADADIPHIAPPIDVDDPAAEFALLDTVSTPDEWRATRSDFGRIIFPRSDLVRSLKEAADASVKKHGSPVQEWHDRHPATPWWSRKSLRVPVWGPAILAVAIALIGGITQGLADKLTLSVLLISMGLILLCALIIVAGMLARGAGPRFLSRAGIGSRYRWLASSSFFGVLGGSGFADRLKRVLELLRSAESEQYLRQIKTFAFLEDLRAAYRRITPGLRGFKRPSAPVVFLKGITKDNGGVELLQAMSDIRSRRSEFHPPLVIASVHYSHRGDLDLTGAPADRARPGNDTVRDPIRERYQEWEASLGTTQAPSSHGAQPWVLRLPIPEQRPTPGDPPSIAPRRRPAWTWLWSRRSAAGFAALVVVAGLLYWLHLHSTYCQVGWALSANGDTRKVTDADRSTECVGVATHGLSFEDGTESVRLDGGRAERRPGADLATSHGAFTLADLQDRIHRENTAVRTSGKPYVTILYAGMLTAARGHEQSAVTSIRELAGVHLAQRANNAIGQSAAQSSGLRVRVLPVNAGENMAFSRQATDRMLELAGTDHTIIGVVGMGRNNDASQAAITRLNNAGLPVLTTVNSSDSLPKLAHYYGLAATDHDEAVEAAATARRRIGHPVRHAMIVSRGPGYSGDRYSAELAADVGAQLRAKTTPVAYDGADDIGGQVAGACASSAADPYDLIYFAGRAEDLNGLVNGVNTSVCARRPMTLIGGDEMSRVRYGAGKYDVLLPANLTTYYTTFTYLPNLTAHHRDQVNPFFVLARNDYGIGAEQGGPLADGQMALAYDATTALTGAAQKAFTTLGLSAGGDRIAGSDAVTPGAVLLELPNTNLMAAATGALDLSHDTHAPNGSGHRGLTVVKVSVVNGTPVYRPICGRLNGDRRVRGLTPCDARP